MYNGLFGGITGCRPGLRARLAFPHGVSEVGDETRSRPDLEARRATGRRPEAASFLTSFCAFAVKSNTMIWKVRERG